VPVKFSPSWQVRVSHKKIAKKNTNYEATNHKFKIYVSMNEKRHPSPLLGRNDLLSLLIIPAGQDTGFMEPLMSAIRSADDLHLHTRIIDTLHRHSRRTAAVAGL
jgi:hypothetical protein